MTNQWKVRVQQLLKDEATVLVGGDCYVRVDAAEIRNGDDGCVIVFLHHGQEAFSLNTDVVLPVGNSMFLNGLEILMKVHFE